LAATVYSLKRLRCGAYGQVFTAQEPEGVGPYDETVVVMTAQLQYGLHASGTSRPRAAGPHAGGTGSLLLLRSYQRRINAGREVLAMIAAFVTSVTLQAISIQTSQWILRG